MFAAGAKRLRGFSPCARFAGVGIFVKRVEQLSERDLWTFSNGFSSSITGCRPKQRSRFRASSADRDGHRPADRRGFSAIGVIYSVREENVAFLEFSRHFRRHGLPVPEIYAEDLSQSAYLEEDLGDTTLFEFLGRIAPAKS